MAGSGTLLPVVATGLAGKASCSPRLAAPPMAFYTGVSAIACRIADI